MNQMQQFLYKTKEEFHKYRNFVFVIFVFCMAAAMSFFATSDMHNSSAANLSNFNPSNIISDAVMGNYQSMTVADIQNFLSSKNRCDNRDYDLYLQYTNKYPTRTWHWEGEPYNGHFVCISEEKFGDEEAIGVPNGMTAAEIIYDAARQNKINPQVLLVLLQKESSLITDKIPNNIDYRHATGYGCPDTAACDARYYGLKNQIYRAAELFRYTLDHGYYVYPEGGYAYVGYNPSSSCGGTTIKIENRATAALYRYTPYQPNSAALNAGYGTGDTCSAYGNRNFYLYFTDWFGSTQAAVDGELITIPDGEYSLVSAVSSSRSLGLKGSNAELTAFETTSQTQRWKIQRDPTSNYYQITNISTGQPLIAQSTAPSMGTNVLSGASTTCSKNWKIYHTADSYLTFESACSGGVVLDVYGGNDSIGTNVQTWLTHGGKSQKWQLYAGQTLDDGIYQIASSIDSSQVLDINSGNDANGTNVSIWQQYQAKGHQVWQIQYQASGGYYSIINPYTGKSLDASSSTVRNGTNIAIWERNSGCAQKWQIIPNGDNYSVYSLCSIKYALDLSSSSVKNGTNVSLWQYHGGPNQQWILRAPTPAIADGTYTITSRVSKTASFDVLDSANKDGANVAMWQLHGGPNQQWQLTYNPADGTYRILNPGSKLYLGLASQNANNGVNVQLQNDTDICSTKWYIYAETDNYFRITSACRPRALIDLNNNNGFHNGNNITIWQSHGGANQQWQFSKV